MSAANQDRGWAVGHAAVSAAALVALCGAASVEAGAQVAVRGETVYTMAGAPITDGVVVVTDGRIAEVGPAASVRIPQGYRVLTAKVVTPGLIDAHTVVGLAGALATDNDQDQLERSNPIQPELRALDAYNAEDKLIAYLRSLGVTTLHTGHGPGALVSGQTMVVRTVGDHIGDALVDSATMVAFTLGQGVTSNFSPRSPGTRAKGVAMLREQLIKARDYARKQQGPAD
jgi:imidazolonepropionase-like amidohydrolase